MPRNILVPADGSPAAEAAAWYAAALADGDGGLVHLVGTSDPSAAARTGDAGRPGPRRNVDGALGDIAGALRAAGLRVSDSTWRCGLVAALCAAAAAEDADLVVVPAGWDALARELRWRVDCRVELLVVGDGRHPGFHPLPVQRLSCAPSTA